MRVQGVAQLDFFFFSSSNDVKGQIQGQILGQLISNGFILKGNCIRPYINTQ